MKNLFLLLALISCAAVEKKTEIKPAQQVVEQIEQVESGKTYYTTKLKRPWIDETIKVANCVTDNKDFLSEVKAIKKFNHTKDTGIEVVKNITSPFKVEIGLFKKWNPWSRTIAKYSNGRFQWNTRKAPHKQPLKKRIETVVHERSHKWYKHKGNTNNAYNRGTVPYMLGAIAMKYVESCL